MSQPNNSLKIYQTNIFPDRNMIVEDLETYLSSEATLMYEDSNFQYIRTQMDQSIKIDIKTATFIKDQIEDDDDTTIKPNLGNYVRLVLKNPAATSNNMYVYYFINRAEWVAEYTVRLYLQLDVLNTFYDSFKENISDRTHVLREHKDRFTETYSTTTKLRRNIDKFSENLNPILYKQSRTTINQQNYSGQKWYLIYRTEYEDKESDSSNPIHCYCISDSAISVKFEATNNEIVPTMLQPYMFYYIVDNGYVLEADNYTYRSTYSNMTPTRSRIICFYRSGDSYIYATQLQDEGTGIRNDGFRQHSSLEITATPTSPSYIVAARISPTYVVIAGQSIRSDVIADTISTQINASTESSAVLSTISEVDRINSKLMKIIELPYSPFTPSVSLGYMSIPTGWVVNSVKLGANDTDLLVLELQDLNKEFISIINALDLATIYSVDFDRTEEGAIQDYDSKFESKLYNSSFYQIKLSYDTFQATLRLEEYKIANANQFQVNLYFKPSNQMNSNLAFRYDPVSFSTQETLDYEQYILSNRDNEIQIYNAQYLNYLRYGKQYDLNNLISNALSAGASSIVSSGATAAIMAAGLAPATAPFALTAGIIGSAISIGASIYNQINSIQEKEEKYKNQAVNVQGNNDLDVFKYYNGNALVEFKYSLSNEMKTAIFNLLRLTGYATDETKVPSLNTRVFYNFIQAEIEFENSENDIYAAYINYIKEKFKAGITIFHRWGGTYDLEQANENWEQWIFQEPEIEG